ncbi:uncharacterized protein CDV56_104868 [Aspergillus thermomutatus]|uniref:Beta-xylosidase C-terminal Concanavalin A-like domain-containing protein n=1 Tax=Aspergillus thermomutatus TaxID=41047 RepID=A0A397GSW5_ASPTH|nr:uncharacterized protein CDV56_104868 [Aspergillus thermomutatus]RHZ53915.1 hypothetical protein CDV56_104868 [Aspergillus thermomutatus]
MAASANANSTYTNPILPGWHSDPSCIFVPEQDNTFFCTVSTFLTFPGIPIYASKDLQNWKLVSNAFNRQSQVPRLANETSQTQQDGLWAPTLRYRTGKFYLATSYVSMQPAFTAQGLLFTSDNPYSDDAWSDPMHFHLGDIDPDLFWDDDGTVYVSYAGISQQNLDLKTGATGPAYKIWSGSGGRTPEGPHIYKKDGWYYLSIGEGGTELGHRQTVARSRRVSGPYEGYSGNPLLTNANTTEYFQTVGHADFFEDANGNWWGAALATRSGPQWTVYPMGRELVLFPVRWEEGDWPVVDQVRGRMDGWDLPSAGSCKGIPGDGAYVDASDDVHFAPGSSIPSHFLYWRFPKEDSFAVSPPGHPFSLRLLPSESITGNGVPGNDVESTAITLIMRRQSHTYFAYSVDVSFGPQVDGEEVGVTVFLTQFQHIDLGIVLLPSAEDSDTLVPHVRFRVTYLGAQGVDIPETIIQPLTQRHSSSTVQARLQIQAVNTTHYALSARVLGVAEFKFETHAEARLVSGGTGPFTGALLGVYATSNGGLGQTASYISNWKYHGHGQYIGG